MHCYIVKYYYSKAGVNILQGSAAMHLSRNILQLLAPPRTPLVETYSAPPSVWKVGYLLQRCLHVNSWPEALYNLGSGSWLAWANDTAAHYAAIHCPRWRTIGPPVQHTDIPPPRSATLGLQPVARKLLLISVPRRVGGWVDLSIQFKVQVQWRLINHICIISAPPNSSAGGERACCPLQRNVPLL